MPLPATATDRFPPQIKYIIGNEGCERFSFYGLKNVLTFFLIHYLLQRLPPETREATGKAYYHYFVSAVYFFPLLGGLLSDILIGKYRTIFWLSLVYSLGNACLALFVDNELGFYAGLGLIALGSGGIKPCVSSLVGDQFTERNKHLVKRVFALFYWIINFGSFFASLSVPKVLEWFGPRVAFGIPGVLMATSTLVLWLGRKQYVNVPPSGGNPHSFLRVAFSALKAPRQAKAAHWLDRAAGLHPAEAIEGAKAVLRIIVLFAPIPIFWALWDQKGSTWIVQATAMDRQVGPWQLAPSQLMALNPAMVMLIIPFNEYVLYPALERIGLKPTPLRRMTAGMFVTGLGFVIVGVLQVILDGGTQLSVLWQSIPYLLITIAEVLVSATGLEFAYSQAPRQMKGTIMSFFFLTTTVGNLITAEVSALNIFKGATQYFFYAGLIFVAASAFAVLAYRFVVVDWFMKDEAAPVPAPAAALGERAPTKARTA